MSRNVRQKSTKTPPSAKKSVKKTRRIDDTYSSDDDYSGVDLISDSEDDDEDVKAAEERAIIESEYEDDDDNAPATSQPYESGTPEDDHSSWGGFDVDAEMRNLNSEHETFFNDAVNLNQANAAQHDHPSKQRRVHFNFSDSEDEDEEINSIFPDIFVEQDRLDPGFRREIENDYNQQNDDNVSDDGSFWDFGGDVHDMQIDSSPEKKPEANPVKESSSEEEESSTDYDSDEGDTTEEETDLPGGNRIVNTKSVLRRESIDSSSSEEEIQVTRRNPYPVRRRLPQIGTWFADPSRPFAYVDTTNKKLVVYKGRSGRTQSFSGSSARLLNSFMPDFGIPESPMISNSGNVMLSAMYNLGGTTGGQAVGPPEAFYPFVSINADGVMSQDEPSSYDEDDMEEDTAWDLQDIFDFGDDSDDDEDDDDDGSDPNVTDGPSTPGRRGSMITSEDQVHPLLEHFDRASVGAFRRNQHRHALITRNSASKDSLAFTGPFGAPIRGIRSDRMAAANAPITPIRRSKAKVNLQQTSPAVEASDKKRKFSGQGQLQHQVGHKRTRSLGS